MINRQTLLDDLKPLLKQLEADLRARCDEVAEIDAGLQREYQQARAADRTGATFEEWRADLITQVAVAWVLSCVFVRFLEDNGLIHPPRISGRVSDQRTEDSSQQSAISNQQGGKAESGWLNADKPIADSFAGMARARDERDLYFKSHPKDTDRDYLLAVFDDLAKLPGTKDVFGPHNPVSAYRNWLSGDAAQKLIEFFQKIDTDGTGEIIHDFTDADWDTRFLGDLYQDLSEAARKKYALLQTPVFVEEFILERTLEPAIKEFGLAGFKMIDPACGSGHFLLGGFARILAHWRKQEPGTPDRELVNRAIAAIHGVDLNPYAVAIARFRLLVAAMRECHIGRLKDAPSFTFNLACGDSLLHGSPGSEQQVLGFHELAHAYQSEDLAELQRILRPGSYHAVVANPPYITVKDAALNEAYRDRYPDVCHRKYSLSAPFFQRLFSLAAHSGYIGQITANSFMKREFGKKLVEEYLPKIDLTHVIDTAGAFIPGHATPTVIIFGRNRAPCTATLRVVMGLRGEPATPDDPAQGKVWGEILAYLDTTNSQGQHITVSDRPREQFHRHPWSIGGGGASELKMFMDSVADGNLDQLVSAIGVFGMTNAEAVMITGLAAFQRRSVESEILRTIVTGEAVRDWQIEVDECCLFPYAEGGLITLLDYPGLHRWLWPSRTTLGNRATFSKRTYFEEGRPWWMWHQVTLDRLDTQLSITFANIASHNHFALERERSVFNVTAFMIKLPSNATEEDHLALLGFLNSSSACFWLKQIAHQKQMMAGDSIRFEIKSKVPYAFSGTQVGQMPVPASFKRGALRQRLVDLARNAEATALALTGLTARSAIEHALNETTDIASCWQQMLSRRETLKANLVVLQEDIDFLVYRMFDLIKDPVQSETVVTPVMRAQAGERPFEILLGESVEGFIVPRHIPPQWPSLQRELWQSRLTSISNSSELRLIEDAHYKRRWIGRQGKFNTTSKSDDLESACESWLIQRTESYFDLDGRMSHEKRVTAHASLREPRLTGIAQLADVARADKDFMRVAELYVGRMDFDVANLVGELVATDSVPVLPSLRYKPSGMDKRAAWERTWDLQRLEDSVDALFEVERLKKIDTGKAEAALRPAVQALRIEEQHKAAVLRELVGVAGYVAEAARQNADLTSELILKPITDAAKRAKKTAIGDIPVPPKYENADFLSSDCWRLRGKLDVPKERWVSFPHCEGEDGTLVIAWAGYDHLQLARAIAERYELAKEQEGRKLVPLLAAIGQLIPWLKQWHNELDPAFGTRMGDYFEGYLAEEAKAMGKSVDEVMAWTPPEKVRKKRRGDAATR